MASPGTPKSPRNTQVWWVYDEASGECECALCACLHLPTVRVSLSLSLSLSVSAHANMIPIMHPIMHLQRRAPLP